MKDIGSKPTQFDSIWGTFKSSKEVRIFVSSKFGVNINQKHTVSTIPSKISVKFYKKYKSFFKLLNLDLIDVKNKTFQELYIFWNV